MIGQLLSILKNPANIRPNIILNSVADLDQVHLKGIKAIVFDKDDTLTPHGEYDPPQIIFSRIQELKKMYLCLVVSNDPNLNALRMVGGLPILPTRLKKPHNFYQIQRHLNGGSQKIENSQIAIVGDRLLTDTFMANMHGCRSIYVRPLEPTNIKKHGFWVWFFRHLQDFYMSRF